MLFPIQRAVRVNSNNVLEFREPVHAKTRSQDLEPMYHDVGMFYFGNTEKLLVNKAFMGPQSSYLEIDEQYVQDIDNDSDWKMVELKYRIYLGENNA